MNNLEKKEMIRQMKRLTLFFLALFNLFVQPTYAQAISKKNNTIFKTISSIDITFFVLFIIALLLATIIAVLLIRIRHMNKIQEEKKFAESILNGLQKNEFKLYLQFIVDNKTKKVVSAEALSRWDRGEKGLVGPRSYIENMESAGLISKHDFYMFELACNQLEKWSNTQYKDISISCNFTRITLSEENFIDKLTMISDGFDFDRSKLAIEITEDAMEKNRETATQNVRRCKEKISAKKYYGGI